MELLDEVSRIKKIIDVGYKVYNQYSWLLDSYVLDFFIKNHWQRLPTCWQNLLHDLTPTEIARLLNFDATMTGKLLPLSLLALRKIVVTYTLPRKPICLNIDNSEWLADKKLMKFFWKNVKAKKQHEITRISKVCYKTAKETDCFTIIDVGAGLGHLSRMLNYGFGFRVCTIEAQSALTEQAKKLDKEFEQILLKKTKCLKKINNVHLNMRIEADITVPDLIQTIKLALAIKDEDFSFGIVGLHPCGDLCPILLKLFNNCNNVKFINIVGCCYMKLLPCNKGFPLSQTCRNKQLSYHSKEIACHAIENYIDRLDVGECWKLKIHTFRAVLEKLIVEVDPLFKHSALSSVKYTQDLSFKDYCAKATNRLAISIAESRIVSKETEVLLKDWQKVIVFYSLRLLLAPLIETIILLDWTLYFKEIGINCEISPIFDATISPRNQILSAKK